MNPEQGHALLQAVKRHGERSGQALVHPCTGADCLDEALPRGTDEHGNLQFFKFRYGTYYIKIVGYIFAKANAGIGYNPAFFDPGSRAKFNAPMQKIRNFLHRVDVGGITLHGAGKALHMH